jgi:hypothetical protein
MHLNLPFTWTRSGMGARPPSIRIQSVSLSVPFLTKGLTGVAAEVLRRSVGNHHRDIGGLQHDDPVRRRQDPLTHAALSPGQQRAEGQGLAGRLAVAASGGAERRAEPPRWRCLWARSSIRLPAAAAPTAPPTVKTPWGEIAYQLGGESALAVLAEHERQAVAPGGDVIRAFLPKDRPVLILMDELMNFVSRSRKTGMASAALQLSRTT